MVIIDGNFTVDARESWRPYVHLQNLGKRYRPVKSPDLVTSGLLPLQCEKHKLSLEPSMKPAMPGEPGTLAACAC